MINKTRRIVVCAVLLTGSALSLEAAGPVHFKEWHEFYQFIVKDYQARAMLEKADEATVTKLAAESVSEFIYDAVPRSPVVLILVKPSYKKLVNATWIDTLRGASNNGLFYLVQMQESGLDLIDTLEGNQCRHESISDHGRQKIKFVCGWHMSVSENPSQS